MQELQDALDQEASIDFAEVQEETVGSLHKRLAGQNRLSLCLCWYSINMRLKAFGPMQ